MNAKSRYDHLSSYRSQFLDTAVECSKLTIPYLIQRDEFRITHQTLKQPWQSVGAKGVVTLASKLMLSLLPPQTTFFKLQLRDDKLGEELAPEMRSELDLSFAKMERMVMDSVAASSDRVVVHQALKHLVVGGNALIFMGKDGLKHYPLNRYVVDRDGNGNVIEIVTKELINKQLLPDDILKDSPPVMDESFAQENDVEVYTHVRLDNNRWLWYQEVYGKKIPKSESKAPADASPWLVLRFNSVDGENYGRGRVEEFLGDLKSLDALSQALVEGSAAAAKVVFVVSPSSTTKAQTLAKAGNGAIVQGRPDDIGVIQVGKTADFSTAANMSANLERRLSDAFLIMSVRQAERVTAEEVRLTQLELEQQLGGLFSLLTVEFLLPYLNRKLLVLQRSGQLPRIPKDLVNPTIVAGINALGRGQDRESLTSFIMTIAQTLGPEALMQFINTDEAIKRLAAAQGIDILNLVKSTEQLEQEKAEAAQAQEDMALMGQAGNLLKSPLADPSKNPMAGDTVNAVMGEDVIPPMQ
jgi:hypothetical protein